MNCINCHGLENTFNELNLTSYSNLMNGGINGQPVIPGNSTESLIILKLSSTPPFGSQMPFENPPLSDENIKLIKTWIDKGAENN